MFLVSRLSRFNNQNGFGMLEASVAIFIMAGSLMILTTTVNVNNDSNTSVESKSVMQSFIRAAKQVLSTEEGCRRNFLGLTWTGASGSFVTRTQIVDQQNNKVIEVGERVGRYVFRTATLRQASLTRTTATHNYHQAIVDFSLSDAITNAVYPGNSLRIPIQLVVSRSTNTVTSCYSIGEETPFATQVALPSCGSGQILNGLQPNGNPICVPLVCSVPTPVPTGTTSCTGIGGVVTYAQPCCSGCKEPIGATTNFTCRDAAVCGPGLPPPTAPDLVVVTGGTCNGCPGGVAPPAALCRVETAIETSCSTAVEADILSMNPQIAGSNLSRCNRGSGSYFQVCPGPQTVPLPGGGTLDFQNVTARQIIDAGGYSSGDVMVSVNSPTAAQLTALGIPTPAAGAPNPGVNILIRPVTNGGTTAPEVVATESYVPVTYANANASGGVALGQVNRDAQGNVIAGAVTYPRTLAGVTSNVAEIYEAVPNPTPGETSSCQRQRNVVDGVETAVCVTCPGGPTVCN